MSEYDILWLFDQSSNHTIKSNDALNANRMIVKPGGKKHTNYEEYWVGGSIFFNDKF